MLTTAPHPERGPCKEGGDGIYTPLTPLGKKVVWVQIQWGRKPKGVLSDFPTILVKETARSFGEGK